MARRSEEPAGPVGVLLGAFGLVVVAVGAPGLLGGVAVGELLRRRALRASWALLGCAPALLIVWLAVPTMVRDAPAVAARVVDGQASAEALLELLVPWWVALVAPVAGGWMLWRARGDRIHGGAAELALARRHGPLELARRARHNSRQRGAGGTAAEGVLLGCDERGWAVRVPGLRAHATIVGGSNTGKTNTAAVLLEGHVAAGCGFVVLDGKGGRDLPRLALLLAQRYRRPVALWSLRPYGDAQLDALRLAWNVTGDGDPTEIKDRIAASEEQTEPYYAAIAAQGLLAANQALCRLDGQVRLDELARVLGDPAALKEALQAADPDRFARTIGWLDALTEGERSGLRGMGLRLRTMVSSDGGQWLLPDAQGREINLFRAMTEGWLVVFTLPQGTYPQLIPHVARYALQAANGVCSRVEGEGRPTNAVVFVDELSAFDGDQLAATFERARSAGVRVVVATQSLSNFESAGGDKLLDAALDNSELLIIHRQAVPAAAEKLAGVGGTEETWEHTHKVDADRFTVGGRLHTALGLDEPGERARRLSDRFRAHPNRIKQLGQGEAIVIAHRPTFTVRQLRIRPGLTAQPAPAPSAPIEANGRRGASPTLRPPAVHPGKE